MIRNKWQLLSVALTVLVTFEAWSNDLPRGRPEDVGFDAARINQMDRILADEVDQGKMAGIVTLIARHGKIVHLNAIGYADISKGRKLQLDSIFRIYSMTKPITSAALMMLYEEGRFQLTDSVMKYIPEFANLRVMRNNEGPDGDT